jgi:CRISPR/Cas system-associated exonuclease Cas4 (RecB family)
MTDNNFIPPDIASLLGLVDTFIRWKESQDHKDREYHNYHPSELGKCLRAQQYKHFVQKGFIPEPERSGHSGQALRLFHKGHNMHSRWQNWYFAEMGVLRGRWKCSNYFCEAFDEVGQNIYDSLTPEQLTAIHDGKTRMYGCEDKIGCFKPEKCVCGCKKFHYCELPVVSEELNIAGHADLVLDFSHFDPSKYIGVRKAFNEEVLPKKPIVIDMKTCNDWQWQSQIMKYGVHKEYIIQVTLYTHLLDCEYGVVIYENKNDSRAMAYKVDRNDDIFNTVRKQIKMMIALADRRLLPPPRPGDKQDTECKYCDFAARCHQSKIWSDPKLNEKRKLFYDNLL